MTRLIGLAAELAERASTHGPITIGLAGAGQMGTDIVVQVGLLPGVRIGAILELRIDNAIEAVLLSGRARGDVAMATSANDVDHAIEANRIAVTEHHEALCAAGRIDVVIDATGNPNVGTLVALEAMKHGKHVVMLNVEADITIGRFLKAEAAKAGVVFTGAAGDEPACALEIIAFAQSCGFDIVSAGKGKNNPLRFDAMPEQFEAEARARNMSPRMLVEFVDGSKTMIEMTAIANATGLKPDVPGMHGPAADREALAGVLCTEADGGILRKAGVVDYTIGKGVAPGVFCIVKPRHGRVAERMSDLKMGPGPCYALIRPYHLTSLEVPLSAIRAVIHKRADMVPLDNPVAECVTVAKRDLTPGQTLEAIGLHDYRGFAMTWEDARADGAIPLGLAEKARVTKPIRAGEKLTYANCTPDPSLIVTQIRQRLDQADAHFVGPAA